MIHKFLLFLFISASLASANTLTILSGDGQVVAANTGEHGTPIVFQVTSGSTPVPGAVISFSNPSGFGGIPITLTSVTTDANGMATVGFAPGIISGVSELFTLVAASADSNSVTFHETAALFPPTATALTSPPPSALFPYNASAGIPGAPLSVSIFAQSALQYVSVSPITVLTGTPIPPGTLLQSVGCLVNGVIVSQVLTDVHGNATCVPVFSQPTAALNYKYETGQFRVLIGGSLEYGPFPTNILASPPLVSGGPKNLLVVAGVPVSTPITITGGTAPFTFTLAPGSPLLPSGLSLQSDGLITGTPTSPGIYPFVVQVTDALGKVANSSTLGLSLAVSGGPFVATPAALPEAVVGIPYSATAIVSGGVPPYKLSSGGNPPGGLGIAFGTGATANTLTVAGTPTLAGPVPFSIVGLDALNTPFQIALPILVSPKLTVPPATLPVTPANAPYTFQLVPTNGAPPYTFTSTDLPAGLTMTPGGLLSGAPTKIGLDSFTITVTDGFAESVSTILILPVSGGTLAAAPPATLPAAVATVPYTAQIPLPAGGVPPYSFTLTGSIPAGVTVTKTGLLTGPFPTAGSIPLTYQVTDALGATAAGAVQLSVTPPAPFISAITNGASAATGAVAPGEIVTLYGFEMGPTPGVAGVVTNGAFPSTASGVQVMFGTYAAPLLFVSAGQVNAIVPFEVPTGTTVPVTLTYNGVVSSSVNVAVQGEAPGIFLIGPTQGAILNSDSTVNSATNAAAVGSYVVIFATGSGPLTPALTDGQLATAASTANAAGVSVTIGGVQAPVLYAGAAPGLVAGALQINVTVPSGITPGPAVPVVLTIGGQSTSAGTVTLGIK